MQRRNVLIAFLLALFAPFLRLFRRAPKKFTGTAEYIDLGLVKDFDANESFSVSMWFKSSRAPVKGVKLISPNVEPHTIDIAPKSWVDEDGWHHFVASKWDNTKDAEGICLHVDGVQVSGPEPGRVDLPTLATWDEPRAVRVS